MITILIIISCVVYFFGGCFTFGTLVETEDAGPAFMFAVFWPITWSIAIGAAVAREFRR